MQGKGAFATEITVNVFRLLKSKGVATAYVERDSVTSFVAKHCDMLPYKVVVCRKAYGSILERNPKLASGECFGDLLTEFFLKTNRKKLGEHDLPCDDPLMYISVGDSDDVIKSIRLHHPRKLFDLTKPFLKLSPQEVFSHNENLDVLTKMTEVARAIFLILEKAWERQGLILADLQIEFGMTQDGRLVVADVIDADSWCLLDAVGKHFDNHVYKNGGSIKELRRCYMHVAGMTKRFIPQPVVK